MRKMFLSSVPVLAVILTACLLAPEAGAAPAGGKSWERVTVKRDWRQQYSPMTASMNLWLTRRVRQPNGSYRDESFSCWLRLDCRINGAPLRAGEEESFEVQARDMGHSGDDPIVQVDIRPVTTYYQYYGQHRTLIIRHNGMVNESWYLTAGFRLREPAPATIDKMSVAFTTPASPVAFTWRDYGVSDNPGSVAEYRFRVGRTRGLSPDVIVAEGELGTAATVTLTANSSYCQGHPEYFKMGEKYRLVLWMKRKGSDIYSEDWGSAEWGTFVFRQGSQMMQAPTAEKILLPEQEKFNKLYSGQ